MDDLTTAILDAWAEHGQRILSDSLELEKRLARRRMKTFRKPLRTWCLAVRANDTRITPMTEILTPYHAADPRFPRNYASHDVTIIAKTLRRLCRPVHIEPCGRPISEVAKMLGVAPWGLEYAVRTGALRAGFNDWGKRNTRVRVIKCDRPLDPSASNLKAGTDPLLMGAWPTLADAVPDDLEQDIERVPWIHPVHGTFYGWRWVCPGCKRQVKTIFYPLPPVNLPEFFGFDPAKHEFDRIQAPPPTFACVRCHGVRYFNRLGPNMWNELVYHVSGGLLYGYEVKRPSWIYHTRKRKFKPRLNQVPSKRREQVLQELLKGMMYKEIAAELGIRIGTVRMHVDTIYKQNHVHNRQQLIAQLRRTRRPTPVSRRRLRRIDTRVDRL